MQPERIVTNVLENVNSHALPQNTYKFAFQGVATQASRPDFL
jgi:hypothetical protein